jgi:hypothetical protein
MIDNGKRRVRRQRSPEEKWEIFLEVTAEDLAGRRGPEVRCRRVGDYPVTGACEGRGVGGVRVGEAGPAGVDGGCRAGVVARRERPALRSVEGARGRAHVAPWKAALGPFRPGRIACEREDQAELLGLIDAAVGDGWPHARACRVPDLADVRAHRWRARLRENGTLADRDPGGRFTASWPGRNRRSSI